MCIERTEEKERGREREGEREGGRERGREGGRERGREGEREGGRERERETHLISGGAEDIVASGVEADASYSSLVCLQTNNRDTETQTHRASEAVRAGAGLADSLE